MFRYKMLDCMDFNTFLQNIDQLMMEKQHSTDRISKKSYKNDLSSYVTKKLGEGAFGKVYEVVLKHKNNKNVNAALKSVHYESDYDKNQLTNETNFYQEVAPNYPLFFLNYYGCVSGSNNVYIFTEKMDGSLEENNFIYSEQKKHLANRLGNKPLGNKVGLLFHMAMAVYIMHENNYVHYDIKPENFLVKSSTPPIIKVIDYGMVYYEDNSGKKASIRGTPDYIDPNILMGETDSDKYKSDIYSLGLTIIETFYGVMYQIDNYGDKEKIKKEGRQEMYKRIINFKEKRFSDYHNCFNPKFNRSRNCKLSSDMNNYPDAENALKELLLQMIAVESKDRPSSKEVIIVLYYILRNIDSKSIYLPENIKELEKAVYNDHEIDDAPSIYNLKDKYGNFIHAPKINKKNRVPLIFDNLDEDSILNSDLKYDKAKGFVTNEINRSKPAKNYAHNPNKLTQKMMHEGEKLDLVAHTGNQHAQYELKQNASRPNKFINVHKNIEREYRSKDREIIRGKQENMLKDPMMNPMGKHRNPQYFDNNVDKGFPKLNKKHNPADQLMNQRIFGNYDMNFDIRKKVSPAIKNQGKEMNYNTKRNQPVLAKEASFYPKNYADMAYNKDFKNVADINKESPDGYYNLGHGKLPHISSPKVEKPFRNPTNQALGNNYKDKYNEDKTTGFLGKIKNAQNALKGQNLGSNSSRGTITSSNENLKLPKIDDIHRTPIGEKNPKPWLEKNNMNNAELLANHGQGMLDKRKDARYKAQSPFYYMAQKVYI